MLAGHDELGISQPPARSVRPLWMVGFETLKGVRMPRLQAALKAPGLQEYLLEIEMK